MVRRSDWGTVRKQRSGRFQASYTAPDGAIHKAPTTFTTKTDARSWLATQRSKIVEGTWEPASATKRHQEQVERAEVHTASRETLAEYGNRWIENRITPKGLPLTDSTKQGYRVELNGTLAALGKVALADLTEKRVEAWYRQRIKTGKITSASHAYGLLRTILNSAVKDGILASNPCQIQGALTARTGKEVEPPTDAELAIIIANTPDRFQALVTLAAWSALRFGEQIEVRRKDLIDDGDQILIRVRRGVTNIRGVGFKVGDPKTPKSKRDVALPPGASQVLREHLARYVPDNPDALLFPADGGKHLNQGAKDRWWYKAREAAGRPDLPWHGLRHYGMTKYAKTGATLAELMARAGHTTARAAMIYQHATGRDAELARRMEGF